MQIIPKGKSLVLGSQSPRRSALLKDMGLSFRCLSADINESHASTLNGVEIAEYLAQKKANALLNQLADEEILITSDTVVWCNNQSLAKAQNKTEAKEMLTKLSGKSHEVITGFCLAGKNKTVLSHDKVVVHFNPLKADTIEHYIKQYQPYDKAGAYGIQEWIGMIGIKAIEGSFFTVMGLPTHRIFEELINWDN